jgi:hypothetical protein
MLVAFVVFAVGGAASLVAQQDAHIGTWKQNIGKSKYSPSQTPPQSVTRTYEVFEGKGIKMSQETVTADGKKTPGGYSAHFDGKDYKTLANPNFDTIALRRIDSHTFESTLKKAGKLTLTIQVAVSKDGKTMTTTSKGTNASGQSVNSVVVWDRQ